MRARYQLTTRRQSPREASLCAEILSLDVVSVPTQGLLGLPGHWRDSYRIGDDAAWLRVIRQLIDDLDGKPIDDGFGERVQFSYQGSDYMIDLRPTNVDKFNAALEPFVKVAEKVGKARRGRKADVTAKDTGSGRSKEQLQAVRDWAVKNGYDVAPRGRVNAEILDAFDAAH
ncbi:Lsr2 family protein [Rhodococcus erythropolis]|jgi:hypothetical protein|nr:Lsr2 family protein [Rhodococcus erythropolis]OQM77696.1 Nucleoid-associated protein Lsr2 [Rhodococcus sp. 66b]